MCAHEETFREKDRDWDLSIFFPRWPHRGNMKKKGPGLPALGWLSPFQIILQECSSRAAAQAMPRCYWARISGITSHLEVEITQFLGRTITVKSIRSNQRCLRLCWELLRGSTKKMVPEIGKCLQHVLIIAVSVTNIAIQDTFSLDSPV